MKNAGEIVERYFTALYAGDRQTARLYLADNVSFRGPAASFSGADTYLKATEHAVRAVRRVDKRKVFVDGPDVCIFFDMYIDHPVESIAIADWYHLEGDKITSIRSILDTAPLTPRTPAVSSGETARDPVCGMTVAKASAAATRTYEGNTYYFCSRGCAEDFDRQPEQYVPAAG
jgi:YHS domain-containing protein